jgi:hypothetical protein
MYGIYTYRYLAYVDYICPTRHILDDVMMMSDKNKMTPRSLFREAPGWD